MKFQMNTWLENLTQKSKTIFSLFTYKLILQSILTLNRNLNAFIFHFSIKRGHHKIQRKPLRSMWTPQYIRYTLIGHSLLPLVVFLIIYICSLIVYATMMQDSCEKDDDESKKVSKNDIFLAKIFEEVHKNSGVI